MYLSIPKPNNRWSERSEDRGYLGVLALYLSQYNPFAGRQTTYYSFKSLFQKLNTIKKYYRDRAGCCSLIDLKKYGCFPPYPKFSEIKTSIY